MHSNSGTGDIRFIKTTSEKMRLTNDGKLGIAITNPSHQLHVVGTSTVTGNTFIGGNLSIGGTFSGRLALGQTLEANIFTTSGSINISVNLMFQDLLDLVLQHQMLMLISNRQQQHLVQLV